MVWSGYAVLMSGKAESIKINKNPGCLPGSTFVYNEVFKLDFSSAFTHLKSVSLLNSALDLDSVLGSNAEFFENDIIDQEASRSLEDLEIIQEEDMYPSIDTSLNHEEENQEIYEPQSGINPIR
ncbi:hypothetical protein Tco_1268630, partial [Tanacetum coccineum]